MQRTIGGNSRWSLLLLVTALASCEARPERRIEAARVAARLEVATAELSAAPATRPATSPEPARLYSLQSPPAAAASHDPTARVLVPPELPPAVPAPAPEIRAVPDLAEVPDAELLAELRGRMESAGGPAGGLEEPGSRGITAERRVALAFLTVADAGDLTDVETTVAALTAADASPDRQLLAAAYLARAGRLEEARAVAGSIVGHSPAPESITAAPATPTGFRLAGLAFARTIEGPGRFTPADEEDIGPRKSVLVYGEFQDFTSVVESAGGAPSYRREFAAALKLIAPTGEEIDRLEFLPKGRGVQVTSAPGEVVNFWARYKVPAGLEPGDYRIVIEGQDVLGNLTASADLALRIRGARAAAGR